MAQFIILNGDGECDRGARRSAALHRYNEQEPTFAKRQKVDTGGRLAEDSRPGDHGQRLVTSLPYPPRRHIAARPRCRNREGYKRRHPLEVPSIKAST